MIDFYEGQILLIDKPINWTSFDVVNKIRIAIKQKFGNKIKIGHAGTLDPLATGLLVLCTGKFTKKINELTLSNKQYIAKINFGATTPSFDKETDFDAKFSTEHIDIKLINQTLNTFLGKQTQIPPNYSAKKIDGQKAYISARKGKQKELNPQEIEIFEIKLIDYNLPHWIKISLLVSKGTYIRTLANDLGKKMNTGAYLDELRRTSVGDFKIENAQTIDQFLNNLSKQ